MVLIEPAALHAFYDLLRVHVILLIQDFHDFILNHKALTLEVDEMGSGRLVGHAELAGSQLPQSHSVFGLYEDRSE